MKPIHLGAIAAIALAGMIGCSDGTGPEELPSNEGSLRMNFSGALSGSVNATGVAPQSTETTMRSTAFGLDISNLQPGVDAFFVGGIQVDGATTRAVSLVFFGRGTGTYTVDPLCDSPDDRCVFGSIDFISDSSASVGAPRWFEMVSGTLTVTSATATRLVGTFSGLAVEMDEETGQPFGDAELTVTSGTFDVPMITWADLPNFQRERVGPVLELRM